MKKKNFAIRIYQVLAIASFLIGLRYYLLFASPKFGLPRLEMLPGPLSEYSGTIFWVFGLLGCFFVTRIGLIKRKMLHDQINQEMISEKMQNAS